MIRVRFWGTRGSIVTPGRTTQRYGGNTSCIEVVGFEGSEPGAASHPDNPRLILDGGTGLFALQTALMRGPWGRGQGELTFLLTHFHWDHIQGFPFFVPMFITGNRFVFYSVSLEDLESSLERLFTSVYSPIKGVQNVEAHIEYRQLGLTETEIAGFKVQAALNVHHGWAATFRLQYGPHIVVYTSDHEVGNPRVDSRLVELAQGADLWILDAQYTLEEWQLHIHWGHSSHQNAVKLALEAGVDTVVLFHHSPDHDDDFLDRMGREAAEMAAGSGTEVRMARDGMVVNVGK